MADTASDPQEKETDFPIATRLSDRLARIDEAMGRLRAADPPFGLCAECGGLIDARRLEAVPWSPLCGPCADQAEGEDSP